MKNQNRNTLVLWVKNFKKTLHTASILLGLCMATAFVVPEKQQPPHKTETQLRSPVFQHGEHLTYKIYYHLGGAWIGAGEVNFHIEEIGNQYKMMATGKTYSSYEWFFKVDDYFESWVDKSTFYPTIAYRKVSEGKFKVFDKTTFNQKEKQAYFERGRTSSEIDERGTLKMSNVMHDVLSVLYYTRTMDFDNMNIGQTFPVNIMLDKQEYPLSVKFSGREQRSIKNNGTHKTLKLIPQVVAGNVFKDGSKMKIWASDDQNKIPLYIESPVSVGSVRVVLQSCNGLRYPMTSKIN